MLDTLDVLIGFTLVMLVVSMAVTMITQAFSTAIVNLRGICLRAGLSKLLALMDRGLTPPEARSLADHILRNPLVGTAPMIWGKHGLASVIHREELVKLILDFAVPGDAEKVNENRIEKPDGEQAEARADEQAAGADGAQADPATAAPSPAGPTPPEPDPDSLSEEQRLRLKVRKSLALNGISDPAAVLEAVRGAVVELEKTNPELSHNARLNIALLNFAASDYLSKLNAWFDQTIDRVSELFTRRIRAVTVAVAVVLAFVIQLDSVGLMNRLSVDDELRDRLVTQALTDSGQLKEQVDAGEAALDRIAQSGGQSKAPVTPPAPANDAPAQERPQSNPPGQDKGGEGGQPPPGQPQQDEGEKTTEQQLEKARRTIEQLGVVSLPASTEAWKAAWWEDDSFRWPFFFGILLTAALLSLGAPFWYSVLANLLKLRSVIQRKDEVQRIERQTTQTLPQTQAGTVQASVLPPHLAGGEAGDLTARG